MTDYNTCLQTVAAISSAIAAIAAMVVAKKTFSFQKSSLLKKATIEQIQRLLHQLYYLKSFTGQAIIGAGDEDITGLKQRILEIRESVMVLQSMISAHAIPNMKKVCDVVHHLREEDIFAREGATPNVTVSQQLDDAISALINVYRLEIK